MSSIQQKKKVIEDMEFLNTEVARLTGVKSSLDKDIEDRKSQFLDYENESKKYVSQLTLNLEKLEGLKKAEEIKLTDLQIEVTKEQLILEDFKKESSKLISEVKVEKENNDKLFRILEDKGKTLIDFADGLKLKEQDIILLEKSQDEREKILKSREDSVKKAVTDADTISKNAKEAEIRANKKEKDFEDALVLQKNKQKEIDNIGEALSKGKENIVELMNKNEEQLSINKQEAVELKKEKDALLIKEKELNSKEELLVKRETNVMIREGECRIREKTLNIATREKELDAKL